ncbi:MAG: DUF29 domain-containing protein [Geminicoccaceae bacterium]|nr:DUF29 domain-containing protein [Geminicoccaceae bacterium]
MAKVLERPDLFEGNFYVWTERQADLLRARRFDELDLGNLVEEVEDLGKSERNKVLNTASVIIEHFLKLEHSPASGPRDLWRRSIQEHRRRLRGDITPRLRQILDGELTELFREVHDDTAFTLRDDGEDEAVDRLPNDCPCMVEQILGDRLP